MDTLVAIANLSHGRVREEELIYALDRIGKLVLDEGVFEAATSGSDDPVKMLRNIEMGESK